MHMNADKIRITVSIGDDLAEKFTELTRRIGVSGTALVSRTLASELNYLDEIPVNSERARAALKLVTDAETGRLNFTISREDAESMDRICKAKRVGRNAFIESYIHFLVNGAPGVCVGPLALVNQILANPRHEYEQNKEKKSPKERANPYSFLHLDEETIAEVVAIMERS